MRKRVLQQPGWLVVLLTFSSLAVLCFAQPSKPASPNAPAAQDQTTDGRIEREQLPEGLPTFRAVVKEVVVPTTVLDEHGRYVTDLQPEEFRLFDNGKLQRITVETAFYPISLLVAVQANSDVEVALERIKKVGPLFHSLVVGQTGEVAVAAFDHRYQLLTDFTQDPEAIDKAFEKLRPGSSTSALIDAVMQSCRLLAKRPPNNRKVLLLISETRDKGSEGRIRDALTYAQLYNIEIYTVNINRLISTFSRKTPPAPPNPFPAPSRPLPGGVPSTPTTVMMTGVTTGAYGNYIPLFIEIFRQVKAIFVDNPAEVFTKYTGGVEYSFLTYRDLEEAISKLGEHLHSQYIITYNPNNKLEGGWHDIEVRVMRPGLKVYTRPGYWMAAMPE